MSEIHEFTSDATGKYCAYCAMESTHSNHKAVSGQTESMSERLKNAWHWMKLEKVNPEEEIVSEKMEQTERYCRHGFPTDEGCPRCADIHPLEAELASLRSRLAEVETENKKLKLGTCSTLWWEDGDRSFDSPEYYAEERGLKIGDEFELQGARYRDERFRVVKVADESSDDWECEEITAPKPDEFEPYFSIEKRATAAESRLAEVEKERDAQWVSVEERLPENQDYSDSFVPLYIVSDKDGYALAERYDNEWWGEFGVIREVTHWRSLPEPRGDAWGTISRPEGCR